MTHWKIPMAALIGALVTTLSFVGMDDAQSAPAKKATKKPAVAKKLNQRDPGVDLSVNANDALSRLKLLRIQMAIDREEIAALELRIEKIRLQRAFERELWRLENPGGTSKKKEEEEEQPKHQRNIMDEIIVKAISMAPIKEAIVLYRGRVYRLRVGDKIGNSEVADIFEGGLRFKDETGGAKSVGVGR